MTEAPEQVLTTLSRDGSRRWIKPRVSKGRFLTRRRAVAYLLIAIFFLLPFLRAEAPYIGLDGRPLFLLDIVRRHFTIFGYTFLPTDTFLLALGMLFIFVAIFLFTAVFGRLWCGWACPQTVYMEFLYRPLERLFEGTPGRGGDAKRKGLGSKLGFFVVALLVTAIPAHTFLAYFVGVKDLSKWITGSPFDHPTAFLVMAITTLLMFFDFYWFREQLCLIACPYGRFQSVLLDRMSMIVTYDRRRGEPRRGKRRTELKVLSSGTAAGDASQGDCVDCHMCVTTCPTGIDIRDGLQMECVNCTQCMDACDAVMDKVGRPRGLIRYSSQAALEMAANETAMAPARRGPRFRVIFYPLLLIVLGIAWLTAFAGKGSADVTVLRNAGSPYSVLDSGQVANGLRLKITNRSDSTATYTFEFIDLPEGRIDLPDKSLTIAAGESLTTGFIVEAPAEAFVMGRRDSKLRVSDGKEYASITSVRLLGPVTATSPANGVRP